MQERKRHSYFQEQSKGFTSEAIFIPDMPINLRADCKVGAWFLGETIYGSRLQEVCLKFSRRLAVGDDIIPAGKPMGLLWFLPVGGGIGTTENGDEVQLPHNLVYWTLIKNSRSEKSGSLINFGQKATLVQSMGYRPIGEVVWVPIFKKKSAVIDGETASYFVLDWQYILQELQDDRTYNRIRDVIEIFQSKEEMSKLIDPTVEQMTHNIDGMEPTATPKGQASFAGIAALVESLRANRVALSAGS